MLERRDRRGPRYGGLMLPGVANSLIGAAGMAGQAVGAATWSVTGTAADTAVSAVSAVTTAVGDAWRVGAVAGRWLGQGRAAVADLVDLGAGRGRRHVWSQRGRAYIEVRGLSGRGSTHGRVAHLAEDAVGRLRGVRWADVNGITGQLLVAFDADAVGVERLVAVVEAAEQAAGAGSEEFPWSRPVHPSDTAPLIAAAVALAGDVLGAAAATAAWVARVPSLPHSARVGVALLQAQPRLRGHLEGLLGPPGTELALAIADAVIQAGTQDPGTLLVDATHRVLIIGEVAARRAVWAGWEPQVQFSVHPPPEQAPQVPGREKELPAGPVEAYTERAAVASLLAASAALALTARPGLAADVMLLGVPRAARLSREAFAAVVGWRLANHGVVPLDSGAYRRLDRVSVVVIDPAALLDGESPAASAGVDPDAAVMLAAARATGLPLVFTATQAELVEAALVAAGEQVLAGEPDLAGQVRRLQAAGHGVLLVAAADDAALAAADVAVAIWRQTNPVCWAADVIADGLAPATVLLRALPAARAASRRGVALAVAGSAAGAALAATRPPASIPTSTRALLPVHTAALIAITTAATSAYRAISSTTPTTPTTRPASSGGRGSRSQRPTLDVELPADPGGTIPETSTTRRSGAKASTTTGNASKDRPSPGRAPRPGPARASPPGPQGRPDG